MKRSRASVQVPSRFACDPLGEGDCGQFRTLSGMPREDRSTPSEPVVATANETGVPAMPVAGGATKLRNGGATACQSTSWRRTHLVRSVPWPPMRITSSSSRSQR